MPERPNRQVAKDREEWERAYDEAMQWRDWQTCEILIDEREQADWYVPEEDAMSEQVANDREPITRDQIGCARCGGEGHPGITYQPFTFPIDFGDGSVATHWALCPTNGEPILYVVVPKDKEAVDG